MSGSTLRLMAVKPSDAASDSAAPKQCPADTTSPPIGDHRDPELRGGLVDKPIARLVGREQPVPAGPDPVPDLLDHAAVTPAAPAADVAGQVGVGQHVLERQAASTRAPVDRLDQHLSQEGNVVAALWLDRPQQHRQTLPTPSRRVEPITRTLVLSQ